VLRANADIVATGAQQTVGEQYALFRRYLDSRIPTAMADMSMLDYSMMTRTAHRHLVDRIPLGGPRATGRRVPYRQLIDGLSLVYSFYPRPVKRSLGAFMILDAIARARALGLPHVYLGYWSRARARWPTSPPTTAGAARAERVDQGRSRLRAAPQHR